MDYNGKNVAVLGLGRSGKAAALLLAREGANVTLLDTNDSEELRRLGETLTPDFEVITGANAANVQARFDQVVLSPGIDPAAPIVRQFSSLGVPMIGEMELAFGFCAPPVIAITGTNGKTTTTELVEMMLKAVGLSTIACGNIGLPFSEVILSPTTLDLVTLEVSSFQLETIVNFQPRIALWLNLSADHLDRYATFDEYRTAKLRIFENQTEEDFAVINSRDQLPSLRAQKITFSAYAPDADLTLKGGAIEYLGNVVSRVEDFHLTGLHNIENIMAALGVAVALQIPFAEVLPALQRYNPAPHRCERVATIAGVEFINDSKATNPDALARALESQADPVILIAGGKDKGFAFDSLNDLVGRQVKKAILIGEMAPSMAQSWKDFVECSLAPSLSEAVEAAQKAAAPGDVVLFSPGTSSFDMFRDYADRGDQFRSLVKHLLTRKSVPILS